MPDLNRVILRGVVSDAPESQTFQQGTRKRVRFTVHTTTMEREDGGAVRERPAWHQVEVTGGKLVETAERLPLESPVYVEGKVHTRSWVQDGGRRYATTVRADLLREVESADPHLNHAIAVGNIGTDPELRELSGFTVLKLRVAMSEGWTPQDPSREHTEWLTVEAYDDLARELHGQLERRQRIYAEGMLSSRTWTDPSGRKRRFTELKARTVSSSGNRTEQAAVRPYGGAQPGQRAPSPGTESEGGGSRPNGAAPDDTGDDPGF